MTGTWHVKATSANSECVLLHNTGSNEFEVLQLVSNGTNSNIATNNSFTASLAADSSSSTWMISGDCLRIKTDTNLFAASSTSSAFAQVASVSSWMAVDD